jgi:protein CLEC16A
MIDFVRIHCCLLGNLLFSVGDESVNRFVSRVPLSDYFSDVVQHFQKQCIDLDKLVASSLR